MKWWNDFPLDERTSVPCLANVRGSDLCCMETRYIWKEHICSIPNICANHRVHHHHITKTKPQSPKYWAHKYKMDDSAPAPIPPDRGAIPVKRRPSLILRTLSMSSVFDDESFTDSVKVLGYEPSLHRSISALASFGCALSIISVPTGVSQLFAYGITNGGPSGLVYGRLLSLVFSRYS